MIWRTWLDSIRPWAQTEQGRFWGKIVQGLFIVAIWGFLAIQLTRVGWRDILNHLPTTPWFYLIFLGMYFLLPLAEMLVYKWTWAFPFRASWPILIRKRVYNVEVLGYSGEVYLYFAARKVLGLSNREVLGTIKDNTIISSVSSATVAFGLLGVFFFSGELAFFTDPDTLLAALIGGIVFAALVAVGFRFRRAIFFLAKRLIRRLFALHFTRLLLINSLQIALWSVVLPDVPFRAWATFLAVQIIVNQIPLLPAKNLVSLGAIVELADGIGVAQAAMAGMLLVQSGLDKGLNALWFLVLSFLQEPIRLEMVKNPPTDISNSPHP